MTAYSKFRDALAFDLLVGKVQTISRDGIASHAMVNSSVNPRQAVEWTERFLNDLETQTASPEMPRSVQSR
jgi:hypothetical protein